MDRFHAIEAFVQVVETGSFARAAERLGVSVSSVSRHVTELEAHLDARLLNRTTRRLSLTEIGRAFHERCVQLLADLEEAEESAGAGAVVPRGTLRLTCGVTLRRRATSRRRSPTSWRAIRRCASTSSCPDRIVDLVEEGFDAAVRIGAVGGQNLVARRVGATQLRLLRRAVVSRAHGEPRAPEDLAAHACLIYEYRRRAASGRSAIRDGRERKVRISGPVHANNGRFLEALAVAGVGITCEPDFIVGPDVGGTARSDPARVRPAGGRHPRRLSEPPPPFGQGARVRRLPDATIHGRRMGARRARAAAARRNPASRR